MTRRAALAGLPAYHAHIGRVRAWIMLRAARLVVR